MSEKSKLGRNPFISKKAHSHKTMRASLEKRVGVIYRMTQAIRWISFDAPIGICFLTYELCLRSLRGRG